MEVAVKIDKPDTKSSKSTNATSLTNSPGQFKQSTVNITTSENPSLQIIKSPNRRLLNPQIHQLKSLHHQIHQLKSPIPQIHLLKLLILQTYQLML